LPAHPDTITAFAAALKGGPPPSFLTAHAPEEVVRRLSVYRNNVATSLSEALAARFPVIQRLVGDDFFAAMARLFAETHRPQSPVLSVWGDSFPTFLETFPPLVSWPFMADVARIEYARGVAFHAADARPIDPTRLAAADPATLCLALHPSVMLLRLTHPAVSIWARHQPGGDQLPTGSGPESALILRDPTFAVHVRALDVGDAALIAALIDGATLGAAALAAQSAAPGHNPQLILVDLMRLGAITEPGT
jgi:hypothetical protein